MYELTHNNEINYLVKWILSCNYEIHLVVTLLAIMDFVAGD